MTGRDSDRGLLYGSPESVGMRSEVFREMERNLSCYTEPAKYDHFSHNAVHPIEPGGAVIVGHKNTIVSSFAFGKRNLYIDLNGSKLPDKLQEVAELDTIYDIASLTKLYAAVAALRQIDAGAIKMKDNVAKFLPGFEENGKSSVTIEMLLTHTSGFAAEPNPPLFHQDVYPTYESRVEAIVKQGLASPPGHTFVYSDLNFMTLFLVLERVTGRAFDELVYDFTRPMGMSSTFFNRGNVEGPEFLHYTRMAPQEFQIATTGPKGPKRPQPVRGTVHDENAWALNGVSGHAGLFSTVEDTAKFCQMILNNGTYNGHRILSPGAVDLIFTNLNARFNRNRFDHGVGFELNQYYTAGPMASPATASHTGFTGTSLVMDRNHDLFYLHFSNRVHPSRHWSSNNIVRQALGYWVGRSLGLDLDYPRLNEPASSSKAEEDATWACGA